LAATIAERNGGVLAAMIGMMNDRLRLSLSYGHLQGLQHEFDS
jgi:hypothetical protein